ncbi:MAG: K(+)-transporting ATPase subunit F [Bacteroidetes bacterium]|nr:K(+)-transporting ATPase subunit F [Bacteroidota bacterium]MBK8345152.1 K(+)-transporting ATPase subunit F [Bacteroidota bacterium]
MPFSTNLLIGSKKFDVMIILLIIAICVFGYMCYVLIKPEKF